MELSAYRFYNLALFCMREDLTEEGLTLLEDNLVKCDNTKHPLKEILNYSQIKTATGSAKPVEKPIYIPPWWNGDDQNATVALTTMKGIQSLPKMG